MYKLYVIPGSHACRAAMLMLEHKRVRYRRVDIVTLLHPVAVRLLGFDAGGERRSVAGRRTRSLRMGDTLGTVPALACDGRRVSTNRRIARFLDERHPEPPLLPTDPERRRAVEEAERWANEELQMEARRVALAWAVKKPADLARQTADGRMGHLLYRRPRARELFIPWLGRAVFAVHPGTSRQVLEELPRLLDRVDGWIAAGVLNGVDLNAADFMVAPSLALMLYNPEARPLLVGRPALALVDRLLPEPVSA